MDDTWLNNLSPARRAIIERERERVRRSTDILGAREYANAEEAKKHILEFVKYKQEVLSMGTALRELSIRFGVATKKIGFTVRQLADRLAEEGRLIQRQARTRRNNTATLYFDMEVWNEHMSIAETQDDPVLYLMQAEEDFISITLGRPRVDLIEPSKK